MVLAIPEAFLPGLELQVNTARCIWVMGVYIVYTRACNYLRCPFCIMLVLGSVVLRSTHSLVKVCISSVTWHSEVGLFRRVSQFMRTLPDYALASAPQSRVTQAMFAFRPACVCAEDWKLSVITLGVT